MKKEKSKPAKTQKSEVLNNFFSTPNKDEYEKTEKNMLLAVQLEKAMREKGYNKVQFATAMEVQPSVITRWLSGTHNFTVDTLFDIESVLSISLVNVSEPKQIQTITTIYFTVSITNKVHSQPFYLNCQPSELVKLNRDNIVLHN